MYDYYSPYTNKLNSMIFGNYLPHLKQAALLCIHLHI